MRFGLDDYTNTTQTPLSISTPPKCVPSCSIEPVQQSGIAWVSYNVTATITAATVVVVVNSGTNTTSTTTLFNDIGSHTLPETNEAGTKVTTIVGSDYLAHTNYTRVLLVRSLLFLSAALMVYFTVRSLLYMLNILGLSDGPEYFQQRPAVQ